MRCAVAYDRWSCELLEAGWVGFMASRWMTAATPGLDNGEGLCDELGSSWYDGLVFRLPSTVATVDGVCAFTRTTGWEVRRGVLAGQLRRISAWRPRAGAASVGGYPLGTAPSRVGLRSRRWAASVSGSLLGAMYVEVWASLFFGQDDSSCRVLQDQAVICDVWGDGGLT